MRLSKQIVRFIWLMLALVVLSACQQQSSGAQTIPPPNVTSAPTPTLQALPTLITEGEIETPTPSNLTAGAVIVDQTLSLDSGQATAQEITFEGVIGVVIKIQGVRQNAEIDYRLILIDKYGTALAQVDTVLGTNTDVISEISLPYDGEYRLNITPIAGAGTVQFSATVLPAATGGGDFELLPIQSGGSMAALGVYHLYKFRLTAGDSISAEVESSGSVQLALALTGPDGRNVEFDGARGVLHEYIVPLTGTYQAVISNQKGGTGEYVFRVWSDVVLPTPSGAADIGYDQQYRASFADKSNLSVTFDGIVGDFLKIDVVEPNRGLNIDIYLYSPYDHIIAFAVDGALNEVQLPYSGRYRLELRPTGSGEAAFSVNRLPTEMLSGGGVFGESIHEVRSGEFSTPNVFHYYQFTAVPNDVISVSLSVPDGADLEMAMALLSPTGQEIGLVESGDESAFGLSLLELRQTGTYTIIVYAINATEGLYDLTFMRE